ncbi:MAG: LiaF transmembrane domain-containing protein [Sphingobacteriales bacterium]
MTDYRNWKEDMSARRYQTRNGRIWTGVFLIIIGVAALAKATFLDLPDWLFTWPMLLVVLGAFIGFKHGFRGPGWLVMMLIGGYFLANDIFPDWIERRYFWPVAIIAIGMFIIIRPKKKCDEWGNRNNKKPKPNTENPPGTSSSPVNDAASSTEDFIDVTAVFGSVKKVVYSKNFKGGKISCIFGGGEINLLQADFTGTAVIELNAIFGGCTLLIPSNWQLRTEPAAIFGGMDDKRSQPSVVSPDKVLVLNGTVMFGGVEIKSY